MRVVPVTGVLLNGKNGAQYATTPLTGRASSGLNAEC